MKLFWLEATQKGFNNGPRSFSYGNEYIKLVRAESEDDARNLVFLASGGPMKPEELRSYDQFDRAAWLNPELVACEEVGQADGETAILKSIEMNG